MQNDHKLSIVCFELHSHNTSLDFDHTIFKSPVLCKKFCFSNGRRLTVKSHNIKCEKWEIFRFF